MSDDHEPIPTPDADPMEFIKRVMHISPEDAAEVREATPATRKRARQGPEPEESGDA